MYIKTFRKKKKKLLEIKGIYVIIFFFFFFFFFCVWRGGARVGYCFLTLFVLLPNILVNTFPVYHCCYQNMAILSTDL